MKRLLMFILFLIPCSVFGQAVSINNITYDINTKNINNTLFVPLRDMADILELDITWSQSDKSVGVENKINSITLYTNQTLMTTETGNVVINTPPTIVDGKTYLPLRIISEQFKYKVSYINGVVLLDFNKYSSAISKKEYDACANEMLSIYDYVYKNYKSMTNDEIKTQYVRINELNYILKDSETCGYDKTYGYRAEELIWEMKGFLDVCKTLTADQVNIYVGYADIRLSNFMSIYKK